MKTPDTSPQIVLHWSVVGLVVGQYLTADGAQRTRAGMRSGFDPDFADLALNGLHSLAGVAIVALIVIRLILHRAPDRAVAWPERIASLAQGGFYAVLVAQATIGFTTSYFGISAAPLHTLGAKLLFAMMALHAAASLWNAAASRVSTATSGLG